MLVRHHEKGWRIISHATHALLAGKIGNCIKRTGVLQSHWPETLTAIINHDDYMVDFSKKNYLTEAGTPLDFMMDGGDNKDAVIHAKSLYKETLQKSQWISILISRHLDFLYKDLPDKEMKQFLDKMHEKRKGQRKLYAINLGMEDRLYNVLRFCDRLSLIICGEEVPKTGRQLKINSSIDGETYYIFQKEDESFGVAPWVFAGDTVEIDLEYRILEQVKFSSNKELEQCIAHAKVQLQQIILRK